MAFLVKFVSFTKISYNPGTYVFRNFFVLPNFSFATSETKCDY